MANPDKRRLPQRMAGLFPGLLYVGMAALPAAATDGNGATVGKTADMTFVYGTIALLSVLLVVGYLLLEKRKDKKFLLLYSCVATANCGYFLLSVSNTLAGAMMANRMAYLGGAYLMFAMLLIILDVCRISFPKWLRMGLAVISTGVFALAATGDWLGLYYAEVSIETINGMTKLVKIYGPLHILYPIYLLAGFAAMAACIGYAAAKKRLTSVKHAVFLGTVVLGNLGVWAVEQIMDVDFEFLSVSYILTEVMLLLLYGLLRDYGILGSGCSPETRPCQPEPVGEKAVSGELPPNMEELLTGFSEKATTLSTAERRILQYYIEGREIAEIPELAYISIHTVKKHNRSIYQKLEVASRDELMLYIELFRRCGRLDELSNVQPLQPETGRSYK